MARSYDNLGTMGSPFDAAEYLRGIGAKAIADPKEHAGFPPGASLVSAAAALCAIDAISPREATDLVAVVVDQLGTAAHFEDSRGPTAQAPPRVPSSDPARACPAEMRLLHGRLRLYFAVFGKDYLAIEATAVGNIHKMWRRNIRISDDKGQSVEAAFDGVAQGNEWRGRLFADKPLRPETPILRVGRSTIALAPPAVPPTVWIETWGRGNRAERYLWMEMSLARIGAGHWRNDEFESAVQALLAAGALEHDSSILAELRAVAAISPLTPNTIVPTDLPEPWYSLLSRAYETGDYCGGSVPIGIVTPPFDGITVRVDGLVTRPGGFETRVEISPGVDYFWHRSCDFTPRPQLALWARDNLGNFYIGRPANKWHMPPGRSEGVISYHPALHPDASSLELLPTSTTQRAVILVPHLPRRSEPLQDVIRLSRLRRSASRSRTSRIQVKTVQHRKRSTPRPNS